MDKTRLAVSQITPGMKLAEPITNASGLTLMPAGIRLTPMFIAHIKKWNIEALDVLVERRPGNPPAAASGEPEAASAAEEDASGEQDLVVSVDEEDFARKLAMDISRVFINVRENPLMMQLRAVVIKKLLEKGPEGAINILHRTPPQTPLPGGEGS